MGDRKDISLAFQRRLAPASGYPAPPEPEHSENKLEVAVVFTSAAATLAAIRRAGALADQLSARIRMLVPQIVPYPLPLESPPVLLDFSERQFREIALQSAVETSVQIHLCRDRSETVNAVLPPRSLVVIGGAKRWWPTKEKSLARQLRRRRHEVIFTEME